MSNAVAAATIQVDLDTNSVIRKANVNMMVSKKMPETAHFDESNKQESFEQNSTNLSIITSKKMAFLPIQCATSLSKMQL